MDPFSRTSLLVAFCFLSSLLPSLAVPAPVPVTPPPDSSTTKRSFDDGWIPLSSHGLMLHHSYFEHTTETLSIDFDGSTSDSHRSTQSDEIFEVWPATDREKDTYERTWFKKLDGVVKRQLTLDNDDKQARDLMRRNATVFVKESKKDVVTTLTNTVTNRADGAVKPTKQNLSPVQKRSKRKHKGGKGHHSKSGTVMDGATISTVITWYDRHDLLNPYCDRKSHWTPTDNSMIVAVTQEWADRPNCGEFMEITAKGKNNKPGKSIVVRVVDLCGGCAPGVPHADLSKSAFTKLYDLGVGSVSGLQMRRVPPPTGPWKVNLWGPKVL